MYHKLFILGNVGRDPEMRNLESGATVISFPVAVNNQYTNSAGEKIKETAWFRVSAWNKLAEICNQYVKKGDQIFVEGRLNYDTETGGPRTFTRQDGSPGSSFELTANNVNFLGGKNNANNNTEDVDIEETNDDEIPF